MKKRVTDSTTKKPPVAKDIPELSLARQCELLGLARSSFYMPGKAEGLTEEEGRAMQIIDETHLERSYYGARPHAKDLAGHGINFGRHRVARLMEHMGIRSTAPQPNTPAPAKHHPKIPYLLRGKGVCLPNQVWATDITCLPLGGGHVHLSAVIDWHSRFIAGWRLHGAPEARECVICMEDAVERRGSPAVGNSDQGPTYTSQVYIDCSSRHGIRQSTDGVRRWAGNIIVERWFRDLKHNCIYQTEHKNMRESKRIIAEYVNKYNYDRLHSSLDCSTPAEWYFSGLNAANAPKSMQANMAA